MTVTSCVWGVGADARRRLIWIRPLCSPAGAAPCPAVPKVPAALGDESWEQEKTFLTNGVLLLIADMPSLSPDSAVSPGLTEPSQG